MGGYWSSGEVPGGGTEGYHVLRVQDGSPGHKAGLEAFFDFIVAIGNTRLNEDNDTLKDLLKANIEKPVKMAVYSSKTQSVRAVTIIPSHNWGGQGLLGVSIRFCSFEGANENVWHVLDVQPNSPADLAGMKTNTDYIIGADSVLHESEDLFTLIENHEGKPLRLYVYNTETDSCREVTLTPNGAWGGEGSLGCGIGYGYLHRIPKRQFPSSKSNVTPSAPPQPSKDGFAERLDHGVPPSGVSPYKQQLRADLNYFQEVPLGGSTGITQDMSNLNINTGTPTIPVIPQADKLPGVQPPMVLPNFSMGAPTGIPPPSTLPAGIGNLPSLTSIPPLTTPVSLPGMPPGVVLPNATTGTPLPNFPMPTSVPLPTSIPLPNFPLPTQTLATSPGGGVPSFSAPTGVPPQVLPTPVSTDTTNVTNVATPAVTQGQTASPEPVAASS
ncbi:Golgi reassembly-stacking protein 2-like isoform X2 [Saccostrea echinata]|uniref:Golgi reassembly-stacking protein 2-like isoform X2 n=1 Tax=Saccostrea echinata TaxID=191078 RepID=UPI002A7FA077|nr:Golgi reassembly-stacking protein 2-like isoform X2 [Saccostrea echinata]